MADKDFDQLVVEEESFLEGGDGPVTISSASEPLPQPNDQALGGNVDLVAVVAVKTLRKVHVGGSWYTFQSGKTSMVPSTVLNHLKEKGIIH